MRYLIVRPAMKLTAEGFDKLLISEEELPPTERRPDLTRAWAQHMNDVREIGVCPTCNRRQSTPIDAQSVDRDQRLNRLIGVESDGC